MREIRGEDTRRFFGVAASILVATILVGCGGLGLLPSKSEMKNTSFKSYQDVEAAYAQITPGHTKPNDLLLIGFDASDSPNMEVLSYLGVIERFIPRNSIRFDNLDPIVQQCIEARDRCTGYVFHPERLHKERLGNWFLDVLGFQRTTVELWLVGRHRAARDGRTRGLQGDVGPPAHRGLPSQRAALGPFQDLTRHRAAHGVGGQQVLG